MHEIEEIKAKPVLVTGATGFVGGHLALKLLELGAEVRVLVRESSDSEKVSALREKGAEIFIGDVTDLGSLRIASRGVEIVFHIAALFRQAKFPDSVYEEVNYRGTQNVLDACEVNQVQRMVHCSTVGVHSHIPNPPANESEAYRPGDIYQYTKAKGEQLARLFFQSGRVAGTVIRPAMIWGEGDKRLLKLFKGIANRRFPMIGTGETLTHWIYVHDLVRAFILASLSQRALGEVYIIAGRQPVSIKKLFNTVAQVAGVKPLPIRIPAAPIQYLGDIVEYLCVPLGIEPPIYRRRVDFFTKDRCFSTDKAKEHLGFEAAQDFEVEVEKIWSWYVSQGWINSGRASERKNFARTLEEIEEAGLREETTETPKEVINR